MILVVSTSSPLVSLAILDRNGNLEFFGQREARGNASGYCLELVSESRVPLNHLTGLVADIGPGGFTGLRVGVMLVKTLAWSLGKPVAGVSSFDLVHPEEIVSLPARKGSWLVRIPGNPPVSSEEFSGIGYGTGASDQNYPSAKRALAIMDRLKWVSAFDLVPQYLLDPAISTPKKAYHPGAVT